MKKVKKFVVMLVLLAMVVSALSACGNQKEESKGSSEKQESTAKSDEDKTEEASTPVEKPVLKWYLYGTTQPDEAAVEEKVNSLLEGKVDATVDFIYLDYKTYQTRVPLMMTAKEQVDIIWVCNWINPMYSTLASSGALLDLTDMMDEYCKELQEVVPAAVLETAKIGGKLYGIPNYQNMAMQDGFFIKKDLADKYNFDMSTIKTIKDLEPYLEVIKQNEPDMIPIEWYLDQEDYEHIASKLYIAKDTTDYKVTRNMEGRKDEARMINEWYNKGYLRQDLTEVNDISGYKLEGKIAFNQAGDFKPGWEEAMVSTHGDHEWVYCTFYEPYIRATQSQGTVNAITAHSEYPELALQLLNIVNTDKEVYNTIVFGVEGEHYNKVGDNTISLIKDSGYDMGLASNWMIGNTFNGYVLEGQPENFNELGLEYNNGVQSPIAGFSFDPTPVKTETANVAAVEKEYTSILFRAHLKEGELDSKFEEFDKKLKEAGIEKIQAEMQRQLDEWVKATK